MKRLSKEQILMLHSQLIEQTGGTPGVRDGKAVLIYGRHGHLDYIDIDALSSQVRECLDRYMTNK